MGRLAAAPSAIVAIAGLAAGGSEATTPAPGPQPREAGAGPILSGEEPAEFCEANFGVTFPVFAKSNVASSRSTRCPRSLAGS